MKRNVLGRGLNALIPDGLSGDDAIVSSIRIDAISPNKNQPRAKMNHDSLHELAASIREHGVVQPILVIRAEGGYQIVAGERRWRAAQVAGLKTIPAIIREFTESQLLEVALIENLQREDLNPIDEASAYQKLMELFGFSQETVAKKVGKERSSIANALRLLRLPGIIRELLAERRISVGHAKTLLSLGTEALQHKVVEQILNQNLSVRQSEELVRKVLENKQPVEKISSPADPNRLAAEDKLRRHLGSKVSIRQTGQGGRIEIEFYSEDDLHRIYTLILGKEACS
ncbi:MAG: ParB/RepB/Spo0J family partition protein [Acidobacteria bacterium]|nr:ParB/RepB/Spo0J family partition protein [Acidobacteriota bacterium]MBI3655346.1 ParB/RepB/Spo0J family partition protein [Acidobacteriota bacterium]